MEGGRESTVSFRLTASNQQKESLEPPPHTSSLASKHSNKRNLHSLPFRLILASKQPAKIESRAAPSHNKETASLSFHRKVHNHPLTPHKNSQRNFFPVKVHSRPLTQPRDSKLFLSYKSSQPPPHTSQKQLEQLLSCKGSQPPPHTTKRQQACPFLQKFTTAPSHHTKIVRAISFLHKFTAAPSHNQETARLLFPTQVHSCHLTPHKNRQQVLSCKGSQPPPHTTRKQSAASFLQRFTATHSQYSIVDNVKYKV